MENSPVLFMSAACACGSMIFRRIYVVTWYTSTAVKWFPRQLGRRKRQKRDRRKSEWVRIMQSQKNQ